jgi:hypothetical protein
MSKVGTRHKWYSLSGIAVRIILLAGKAVPEPADIAFAAAYGIIEVLGVRRFWKILGPMLKAQLKEQLKLRRGDGRG